MSVPTLLGLGISRSAVTGKGKISMQVRASVVLQPGSIVAHRDGIQLAEAPLAASPRTDLVALGTVDGDGQITGSATADSSGGALNADGSPQVITITPLSGAGTGWFATGTGANQITQDSIDQPCFMYDDDTLYLTDLNGTLSFAGFVAAVDPISGRVAVKSDERFRCLYELFSAGRSPAGNVTSDDAVRAVATSIPAGSFANGVFTATAAGAFSTAQDGVTLAVGDKFILPLGTIGSLTVSGANSAVYEMTSLGSSTTKMTFARSAKWAHGAVITPMTTIRVGGEGTLFKGTKWTALPATATKIVGTDDPALYPDEVRQSVALTSSAVAIANVPIRSANSAVTAILQAVGGTTTSTVGYGPIVSPTPGGIGTATTTVNAIASGQTKNGSSDTSTVLVSIRN